MNIAINGFGRIGRLLFRQLAALPDVKVVAINDLGSVENLAYLLKYDTVYGVWDRDVSASEGSLVVDGVSIPFFSEKDPMQLRWGDMGVDVVVEATGVFESFEKAKVHLDAGAKRVLLTAPAKDEDGAIGKTVLLGVNEDRLASCAISSNASCTTNSVSPVMAVLSENPGIAKAILTTVHAYTATQSIVDGPVKGSDVRRGRAGAHNLIPSTTGAAIAVTRALPDLSGKFDGIAVRVPVVAGSLADITFVAKRKTSVEEINAILTTASAEARWQGILKVTSDPVVSSDIVGQSYGAIVDTAFTKVIDGDLVKVLSWYDNEWGYASTLVKHLEKIHATLS